MNTSPKYKKVLSRRTLLRGAGGVAVALPFLEEMTSHSVWGAPQDVPLRFFTVFFAHGLTPAWFRAGLNGMPDANATQPLLAFADLKGKLGLYSGLHQTSSGTHAQSGVQVFTGIAGKGSTDSIRAGGASIDQVLLKNGYPGGRAPTAVQTLCAATFFNTRNYSNQRHSWRDDGQASAQPYEEVADLWKVIMGLAPAGGGPTPVPVTQDPAAQKKALYDKSVLDSVVSEYKRWAGQGGGLGATSRRRIADHLDELRALELRMAGPAGESGGMTGSIPLSSCKSTAPVSPLLRSQVEISGAGSNDRVVDALKWEQLWRTMADVYAMAIACDITRFGNISFQGAGDHVRWDSTWSFRGTPIKFALGAESNHLSWYHNTSSNEQSQANIEARKHTTFSMAQVAYFLKKLDTIAAENGKTLLDTTPVIVSTELGDGGSGHSTQNVFHALSGANGKFKTGVSHMFDTHASNFYNAIVKTLGVSATMGLSRDAMAHDAVANVIKA